jgi:hypothetical protein
VKPLGQQRLYAEIPEHPPSYMFSFRNIKDHGFRKETLLRGGLKDHRVIVKGVITRV